MKKTVNFGIKGLDCPNCPAKIENAISKLDGVHAIKVNYRDEKGNVTFNKEVTDFSNISERITKMGFEVIHSNN